MWRTGSPRLFHIFHSSSSTYVSQDNSEGLKKCNDDFVAITFNFQFKSKNQNKKKTNFDNQFIRKLFHKIFDKFFDFDGGYGSSYPNQKMIFIKCLSQKVFIRKSGPSNKWKNNFNFVITFWNLKIVSNKQFSYIKKHTFPFPLSFSTFNFFAGISETNSDIFNTSELIFEEKTQFCFGVLHAKKNWNFFLTAKPVNKIKRDFILSFLFWHFY